MAEGDDIQAAEERAAKAEAEVERRSAIIEKLEKVAEARKALDKAFFAVLSCAIQSPEAGGDRVADKRVAKVANLLEKFG